MTWGFCLVRYIPLLLAKIISASPLLLQSTSPNLVGHGCLESKLVIFKHYLGELELCLISQTVMRINEVTYQVYAMYNMGFLTIIPRVHLRCEMIDNQRSA